MDSKFNIGIVGFGVVGQALANGFKSDNILYYDKFKDSIPLAETVEKSDYIFICLPTPMHLSEKGIDLSEFKEVIAKISPIANNTEKIIIIKSTVIPGTTKSLQEENPNSKFAFNPEFLTESNFMEDFLNSKRTIIGAFTHDVKEKVGKLYEARFPNSKIFFSDPTTVEFAKYMANAYLALKVSFANQIYDLAEKLGVDYHEAKRLAISDKRIEDTHLDVTRERGFGGKCFPKDTVALLGLANDLGVDLTVVKSSWEYNKKVRKIHDWEDIPFATSKPQESDN